MASTLLPLLLDAHIQVQSGGPSLENDRGPTGDFRFRKLEDPDTFHVRYGEGD